MGVSGCWMYFSVSDVRQHNFNCIYLSPCPRILPKNWMEPCVAIFCRTIIQITLTHGQNASSAQIFRLMRGLCFGWILSEEILNPIQLHFVFAKIKACIVLKTDVTGLRRPVHKTLCQSTWWHKSLLLRTHQPRMTHLINDEVMAELTKYPTTNWSCDKGHLVWNTPSHSDLPKAMQGLK